MRKERIATTKVQLRTAKPNRQGAKDAKVTPRKLSLGAFLAFLAPWRFNLITLIKDEIHTPKGCTR